jgi:hypothetical protein
MSFIRGEGRNQGTLFPVVLDDLVPADHVCRVVDAFVDRLEKGGLFLNSRTLMILNGGQRRDRTADAAFSGLALDNGKSGGRKSYGPRLCMIRDAIANLARSGPPCFLSGVACD